MSPLRLTLVRHAKAEAEQRGDAGDFERRLSPRGERDAVRMGRRLAASGERPDRWLASAAVRARSTAERIVAELGVPLARIELDAKLYLASERVLLERVRASAPEVRHLALVGHNPGITELWHQLVGEVADDMPTCAVVRLALHVDRWFAVAPHSASLLEFDFPKRIDD